MKALMHPGFLTDIQGHVYKVLINSEDTDSFDAWLLDGRTLVGCVHCLLNAPKEMTLCDIRIFEKALIRRNFIQQLWDRLIGKYPRTENYQKRGLGTLLLAMVIEEARRQRVHRITGIIVADDLQRDPHLVRWYSKHGFVAASPASDDPAKAVYRITYSLHDG